MNNDKFAEKRPRKGMPVWLHNALCDIFAAIAIYAMLGGLLYVANTRPEKKPGARQTTNKVVGVMGLGATVILARGIWTMKNRKD